MDSVEHIRQTPEIKTRWATYIHSQCVWLPAFRAVKIDQEGGTARRAEKVIFLFPAESIRFQGVVSLGENDFVAHRIDETIPKFGANTAVADVDGMLIQRGDFHSVPNRSAMAIGVVPDLVVRHYSCVYLSGFVCCVSSSSLDGSWSWSIGHAAFLKRVLKQCSTLQRHDMTLQRRHSYLDAIDSARLRQLYGGALLRTRYLAT